MEISKLNPSEDPTRIDFPRPILRSELDELMQYLFVQSDTRNNTIEEVSLTLTETRRYGERSRIEDQYRSGSEVKVRTAGISGSGTIRGISRAMRSTSFTLRTDYDGLDRQVITGIDFNITPGHKPGELTTDNPEVMKEVGRQVKDYFESAKVLP